MTWKVELVGHRFDLENLPGWLSGGDPKVLKEGEEYLMTSSLFENLTDFGDVERVAIEIVEFINGLAPTIWREFQPIDAGSVVQFDADGKRHRNVHLVGRVRARSKFSAAVRSREGTAIRPRRGPLASLLPTVFRSKSVRHALTFIGRRDITWSDLYRAVEVVQEDVGGLIHDEGWISKSALNRFKQTANSYTVLGIDARHAQQRYKASTQPMAFGEARQAVLDLIGAWVRSKVEDAGEQTPNQPAAAGASAIRR